MHLASVVVLPNSTITQLNKIHKEFIQNHKRPKIKKKTLINNFGKGGLKDVDIPSKIASLQCSRVKRMFDRNFHEWKIIPLFLFEKYFGKKFKFHGSLDIRQYLIRKIPEFCREILLNWSKFLYLGFLNIGNHQWNFLLINHLPLIFKHYLYMSREHGAVCFATLKLNLIKIKTIEQNISP